MEHSTENVSALGNEARNSYVRERLTEALLELLEDKLLADITVIELCERAEVGRTSFYRNFREKDDILKSHIAYLSREWAERCEREGNLSVRETVRIVFSHFEAHRDFYGLLNRLGMTHLLQDALLDAMGFDPDQEIAAAYSSAYVAFFLYGWIEVWFRRGMTDTVDDLLEHLPG